MINSITDPIFVKDRDHRLVQVNDAYCTLAGHNRDNLLGKTDRDFFPEDQTVVFWDKDEAVFQTGKEDVNEEHVTDASGVKRTIITKKSLYAGKTDRKFLVGIIRDITDRIAREE